MADQIRPFLGRDRAAKAAHTTPPRGVEEMVATGGHATKRPGRRDVNEVADRLLAAFDVMQDTHSQLFALLHRSQLVNDVLGVELVTFDSTALIGREYRTQVGSVEVVNHSTTADVIVSSAPPTVQPSGGKGVYRVLAGTRQVVPIGSHTLTLYGTTGQQVSLTAWTKPQAPSGGALQGSTAAGIGTAVQTGLLAAQGAFVVPAVASAATLNVLAQRPGTPLDVSTTAAAGATASVTLPAAASVRTWITGFELTWDSTGTGSVADVLTVTGPGSTLNYAFATAAGAGGQLLIGIPQPIPASAVNTAIVVATGAPAGRAAVALTAHGFRL